MNKHVISTFEIHTYQNASASRQGLLAYVSQEMPVITSLYHTHSNQHQQSEHPPFHPIRQSPFPRVDHNTMTIGNIRSIHISMRESKGPQRIECLQHDPLQESPNEEVQLSY